ncbi:MAG TPA: GNAT family N-acetyltransferase [Edaphobacter sp.]
METGIRIAQDRTQLERCYPLMSQLRPALTAEEFVERVELQQAEKYRLAYLEHEGEIVALAGFRMMNVLWSGRTLYVDDLVTDAAKRSQGYGEQMVRWLEALAKAEGCATLALDSGTHREEAHAFYFRMGLRISDFHFQKKL